MSLRPNATQAIAQALEGEAMPWNASLARRQAVAHAALDALLDYLFAHAEEWVGQASGNELDDAMERGDHKLADVLLAVLRVEP